MEETMSNYMTSQMTYLRNVKTGYSSNERNKILFTLSQLISSFEDDRHDLQLCKETQIIKTMISLIQFNDKMVAYLSTEVLSSFLYHQPDGFEDNILADMMGCNMTNYYDSGLVVSLLNTIYTKMKTNCGVAPHPVYLDIINTCINFITQLPHYSNRTSLNIQNIINTLQIILLLLQIVKIDQSNVDYAISNQSNVDYANSNQSNEEDTLFPQYVELIQYLYEFINGFISGSIVLVENVHCYIMWRLLMKSLLKILDICVNTKHVAMAMRSKQLCHQISSVLYVDSFQSKLLLIQSGFGGVICEVCRNNVFVMDEITGRRLIIFLLETLYVNLNELKSG